MRAVHIQKHASWLFPLLTLAVLSGAGVRASAQAPPAQSPSKLTGTWSGTFFPKHSNVSPFEVSIGITQNNQGRLVSTATLNSPCIHGAQMEITVNGSSLVLAGSDEEGDSLTIRGGLDPTGTLLQVSYILNGSASGRCETDNGTGSLGKR